MSNGLFIVFEGGEGSGKTTMIDSVFKWLNDLQIECIKLREPGGNKIAEEIRNVIVDKSNTDMDPMTEALLYAASRRQNVIDNILPALSDGKIILCDRFVTSSLVYQGYCRGLGIEKIKKLNDEYATFKCKPDLIFWLDIPPKEGLYRINQDSKREVNRLDLENVCFHEKVAEGYKLIAANDQSIRRIDALQSFDEKFNIIKNIISSKLLS